jgi:hypothetical protein
VVIAEFVERGESAKTADRPELQREKLLQAHYADAIPLDLLKSEQDRITTAIASAEGRLATIVADFKTAETNLHKALTRAGDCQAAYREASDRMRRQFNLAFFKRLIISDEGTVSGELAEPWDVILGDELRKAVAVQEAESLEAAIEHAEHEKKRRPREPESILVGATTAATVWGDGWSPNILVRPSGLEPPRTVKSTRPSTLRVYQFRHGRRGASIAPGSRRSWCPRRLPLASVHAPRYSTNTCSL